MSDIRLVRLHNVPIQKQLEYEEALLRADSDNWCILNEGSSDAVVLGISSDPYEHICRDLFLQKPIPVLRRFTGGGVVVVDRNTLFVTFILHKEALPVRPLPESILRWGETFYRSVFQHPSFALKENDYVLGNRKIGGNAKYIRKDRWLLHTSFLWDFDPSKMAYLQNPAKAPPYRKGREHDDFITPLKKEYPDKGFLFENVIRSLPSFFTVKEIYKEIPDDYLLRDHRRSVRLVDLSK